MALKRFAKVRLEVVKERTMYTEKRFLDTPTKAAEFARELYYEMNENECRCPGKEMLMTCCVTTKNEPIVVEYTSVGDCKSTIASVREVLLTPLLSHATGIFVFHNHPSGVPEPSLADNLFYKKLSEASKIMEIEIVDTIILSEEMGFYSFREGKVMPWEENLLMNVG